MKNTDSNRLSTSQILTMIRGCGLFSDLEAVFEKMEQIPTIGEDFYQLLDKRKMRTTDLIVASGIERSYFYHILSGEKVPSRNILLRLCLCLTASLAETNQLLKHAGHATLYARVRRDAIIIYAIQHKLGMAATNDLLLSQHELPLYREDKPYAKR